MPESESFEVNLINRTEGFFEIDSNLTSIFGLNKKFGALNIQKLVNDGYLNLVKKGEETVPFTFDEINESKGDGAHTTHEEKTILYGQLA